MPGDSKNDPVSNPASSARIPRIPDHDLLRPIGRGSYGQVWLARNIMGTFRAIKIVHRDSFDSARPFERELTGIQKFEPVSRLHDGLVDILQVGRNDDAGFFYYIMELADPAVEPAAIPGPPAASARSMRDTRLDPASYAPRTLATEMAARGRLPGAECVPIFLSLAGALGRLHQHGLIHRDIKPANIIFVDGAAKLADIGLVTEPGAGHSYVGTEGYIPPEGPGTREADLYSLGMVFYQVSTGRDVSAFPGLPIELATLAENQGLLELNAIFTRACAHDVRERYRSADEMHADLSLLQSGKSIKRLRTIERRLTQATRLGAIAALLLALVLAAYLISERQRQAVRESFARAESQRRRAERAEQEVREKAETTEKLWNAYLAQMQAGHLDGQRSQRLQMLKALAQAAAVRASAPLRNEAIAALALTDLRHVQTASPKGRVPDWLAYDPKLERCLALDQGTLRLYRAAEVSARTNAAELLRLTNVIAGPVLAVRWSRDGRFVAVILHSHRWQIWDLEQRAPVIQEAAQPDAQLWMFTPDNRQFAIGYADRQLVFRDIPTGATNRLLRLNLRPRGLAFHPDSRQFAAFDERTERVDVCRADTPTLEIIRSWDHPGRLQDLDWSPDGTLLATAGHNQLIYVWDAATGELRQTLRGHASVVTRVKFLEQQSLLGSSSWDGTLRLWEPQTGRQQLNAPGLAFDFDFNPATGRLGFQATDPAHASPLRPSRLQMFELVRSAITRELFEPRNPDWNGPWSVAFSPDERWLVSGSSDGARFWDSATGRMLAHLPGQLTAAIELSSDGASLITCSSAEVLERALTRGPSGEIVVAPGRRLASAQNGKPLVEARRTPQGDLFTSVVGGRLRAIHQGTNITHLNGTENRTRLATSADGQWLAVGHTKAPNVLLLRASDGTLVHTFPTASPATVAFTPANRWLVTGSVEEYRWWNLETHAPGLRITREQDPGLSGRMAFSPDGRMVAIARSQWIVSILDSADGRELARLEHPNQQLISALAFSPSGAQLAVATEAHLIQLWNLRKMREELAALKLDWDQPPFPPPPASSTNEPLRVVVLSP
jgi:WD40 repeat protein